MLVGEGGKLYDVHEECHFAGNCELHKTLDKFSGCQNIVKARGCFYCANKPNHPHIHLTLVWIRRDES